jgi:hypothetical protein
LDGAQTAPPTTAGPQASSLVSKKREKKNPSNDARHVRRLIDNTDVLASLRSDHEAAEPLITMPWTA